ncbi:MAG: choice-of-anchor Q domain-containing protein [Candidatus Rokuibacteriota bacterium]
MTDCGDTTPGGAPGQLRFLILGATAGDTIVIPASCPAIVLTGGPDEDAGQEGDLDIAADLTIRGQGPGVTAIDADQLDRVLNVHGNANLTLENLTLRNGDATKNVSATVGGGIYNSNGTLTLLNVGVVDNRATAGGGIWDDCGAMNLTNFTVSGNVATAGPGGGIRNSCGGGPGETLTNGTVSNNTATAGGGGVYTSQPITLQNVTVAENLADSDGVGNEGGGGIFNEGTVVTIRNTLLAGNTLGGGGTGPSCNEVTSAGHNLIGDDIGCTVLDEDPGTDLIPNANAYLGPLADNGGGLGTRALQAGSAAIDAGGSIGCPATDARRFLRPTDGDADGASACDIGAYERLVSQATLDMSLNQAILRAGEQVSVGVSVTNPGPETHVTALLLFIAPASASDALGCPGGTGPAGAFIVDGGAGAAVVCLGTALPGAYASFAANVVLPPGLAIVTGAAPFTVPNVFSATLPPGMPLGTWQVFMVFAPVNAFADNVLQLADDVLAVDSATFEVVP